MKRFILVVLAIVLSLSSTFAVQYVVVTASNVCFRSCPSEDCKLTGSKWRHMNPGDTFVYLGRVNGYYEIEVGDVVVYVPQRYATIKKSVSSSYVIICGDDVCIRNTPNESGKDCSTKLYWYEEYKYLGSVNNYYKINVAGKVCYVPKKYAYLR
ncbi:MAG: hypothetical protein IJ718_03690 [Paludibacteraceae bacterium]|jgi:hypothetical protein|nr:hypothetical protein [Paludibacteraceae bacterium]